MSVFVSARPIRSMTGYARARASCDLGEIAITLRSVNHRGLDLHFHLAPEIEPHENLLRAALKESLVRGHVDVRASFIPST
ncbi:MAG: YicC/YloC family endoribonuclease, partial [Bryobacteraceae bacterium]